MALSLTWNKKTSHIPDKSSQPIQIYVDVNLIHNSNWWKEGKRMTWKKLKNSATRASTKRIWINKDVVVWIRKYIRCDGEKYTTTEWERTNNHGDRKQEHSSGVVCSMPIVRAIVFRLGLGSLQQHLALKHFGHLFWASWTFFYGYFSSYFSGFFWIQWSALRCFASLFQLLFSSFNCNGNFTFKSCGFDWI